jgi:predicted peptidase
MVGWVEGVLVVLGALLLGAAPAQAGGEKQTGFLDKVYKGSDGYEAKYVVFVPHGYDGKKKYPVILFLHGSGETGTDGQKQVKVGLGPAVKKRDKSFEFIAIFPQSHKRNWRAGSEDGMRALAILDEVEKDYQVDAKRVYLTGLSMGGYGTWSLAAAHPERWAAIVPVCGGGNAKDAEKIKDIPCWCFHGDADKAVKVELSRTMIQALKDAGAQPRYDEYPGVGHNSWDRAYATPELFEWLLQQKRK